MPRMPFIGVRISWLIAARKRALGAIGGLGLIARLGKLRVGAALLGNVAADALHFEAIAARRRDKLFLPFDPPRAGRGQRVLHKALMANVGGNGKRLGVVFLAHLDGEWLAEDFIPSGAEHIEERLIGERQLAGLVAPDDRFVLRVESAR